VLTGVPRHGEVQPIAARPVGVDCLVCNLTGEALGPCQALRMRGPERDAAFGQRAEQVRGLLVPHSAPDLMLRVAM
jgi:hypothetical protein